MAQHKDLTHCSSHECNSIATFIEKREQSDEYGIGSCTFRINRNEIIQQLKEKAKTYSLSDWSHLQNWLHDGHLFAWIYKVEVEVLGNSRSQSKILKFQYGEDEKDYYDSLVSSSSTLQNSGAGYGWPNEWAHNQMVDYLELDKMCDRY
ncbi:MAG: hypothetical protein KA715_08955 [Xanthomonadaceae bacterium]|nr:hypothetical protein [Xanthomonadaceae bacterium]